MREAAFYTKLADNRVQCDLCPHNCTLSPGATGICNVRRNENGRLESLNAGRIVAANVDPMEKKPLYHFHPGAQTLSIAGAGCNFSCDNCQNHQISQAHDALLAATRQSDPASIVRSAMERRVRHITFTYTEPTVFYELMMDTVTEARTAGLTCSVVSNGFINPEPLAQLIPMIQAANIDLKFGNDQVYRSVTGGSMAPVLKTIRTLFEAGVITEVTTLIIPGLTDEPENFDPILKSLRAISTEIPWHLSAFYPTHRMGDRPPTSFDTLRELRGRALDGGIKYVYTGNVLDPDGSSTVCPECGTTLISRYRLSLTENKLTSNQCPECKATIYGKFD